MVGAAGNAGDALGPLLDQVRDGRPQVHQVLRQVEPEWGAEGRRPAVIRTPRRCRR